LKRWSLIKDPKNRFS